ncbi:MAG: glycosyl hydrolase 115 family protein [Rikenellaceae bacterium]|nr:glycosyl hydrolase 115 family protein [Rikenellaceae bacterium]
MDKLLHGLLAFGLCLGHLWASGQVPVSFNARSPLTITVNEREEPVVHTALELFETDYQKVFQLLPVRLPQQGQLRIGTLGAGSEAEKSISPSDIQSLSTLHEGFLITVRDGNLLVLGSDKRGTAYGILELSRRIGVSPWEWWADSEPVPKTEEEVLFEPEFHLLQSPSVAYRGIFVNDEDWGLAPWSWQTHEPSEIPGRIGPQTHARIFELLLRLRANTFWPAMHECSVPFYLTPGNRETADKYGILIGTSHCEPMVRNTNGEWKLHGHGPYNYVTNRENVVRFWEERVEELVHSENIYTLGIRGVHDGKMQGAHTIQEQKEAIAEIIQDQRALISRHLSADVSRIPQVFIPYKEVLEVYQAGLDIPQDVTLMWCDDNYGYLRHFPSAEERARSGGNGIYYHISYWGRPHDYLWLATTHPALIYTQMKQAYDCGARKMWIVNVGDIKPAEYLTELFLDLAWNIDGIENNRQGLQAHLYQWLSREFDPQTAQTILPVMTEYYRLAYIRKPEFMAHTRTEEPDPAWKTPRDLPWTEAEIRERLRQYESLENRITEWSAQIPENKQSSWFQLVEYPVIGASCMNAKHLYAQLVRHGKADWSLYDRAYDRIVALTEQYNSLNQGKWRGMMDHRPRRLAVFDRPEPTRAETSLPEPDDRILARLDGADYSFFERVDGAPGPHPVSHGLGYNGQAVMAQNYRLYYDFPASGIDSVTLQVALLPVHPVNGPTIGYRIYLLGREEEVQHVHYQTQGRSEEWKENVLRNQALRTTIHRLPAHRQNHTLVLETTDPAVILDQIIIRRHP